MIHDVDESLVRLIRRDALNGSDVEVALDAPTKDWAARQNVPTVDVYLYDIRENTARREVMYEPVLGETGRVVGRRPPPRRFDLSYLVTAWTQRPEDEHRLLSALLGCFLRHEVLPPELLQGALADQLHPVHLSVALPASEGHSGSDVWSALGGELKPGLDLTVVAPFAVEREAVAGPPVREEPRLAVRGDNGESEEARRRGSGPSSRRGAQPARAKEVESEETIQGGGEGEPGRTYWLRKLKAP